MEYLIQHFSPLLPFFHPARVLLYLHLFLHKEQHLQYSSLIKLNALYLSQIELATQEDHDNKLVYWAKMFRAKTWDELKEICSNKPELEEVADYMYKSNVQDPQKTLFEAHQKYLMDRNSLSELYADTLERLESAEQTIGAQGALIAQLQQQLAEYKK